MKQRNKTHRGPIRRGRVISGVMACAAAALLVVPAKAAQAPDFVTSRQPPAASMSPKYVSPPIPSAGNRVGPLTTLPTLPQDVTELKFSDFFVMPIGPRGLVFTEKLQGLDGKRVRIIGYMVRRESATPGAFLLSPAPAQLDEDHYGLADDLPASTLHVLMPKDRQEVVEYKPGLLLLTGSLSVGPKEEPDGRISTVRLAVELPKPPRVMTRSASLAKGAERMMR